MDILQNNNFSDINIKNVIRGTQSRIASKPTNWSEAIFHHVGTELILIKFIWTFM